ncbi:hypothetical protein [Paraburkholderia lacunae]|uniref:hypothetical protein n=1 Tax=Paraburkholderia lacunae TaxID=2211104 RepID=UPI001059041F|nr:hypothetical protein [Paraburkholderia lacunae]
MSMMSMSTTPFVFFDLHDWRLGVAIPTFTPIAGVAASRAAGLKKVRRIGLGGNKTDGAAVTLHEPSREARRIIPRSASESLL